MKQLLKSMLAVLVLAGLGAAHATVVNFDGLAANQPFAPSLPFLTHGDGISQNGYAIDTYSTKAGAALGVDLVGVLVDGNDVANTCFSVGCPTNNKTNFLGMLNDGLPEIYRVDGGNFKLMKFDASFMSADGLAIPGAAALLRFIGFSNNVQVAVQDFVLPGPTNGVFSFSTYTLSSLFSTLDIDTIDIYGYACNAAGSCNRSSDTAQFALDNLTFADPVTVPEPGTWMLMGVALAGLAVSRRRRV